jgi:hypothetical protein
LNQPTWPRRGDKEQKGVGGGVEGRRGPWLSARCRAASCRASPSAACRSSLPSTRGRPLLGTAPCVLARLQKLALSGLLPPLQLRLALPQGWRCRCCCPRCACCHRGCACGCGAGSGLESRQASETARGASAQLPTTAGRQAVPAWRPRRPRRLCAPPLLPRPQAWRAPSERRPQTALPQKA